MSSFKIHYIYREYLYNIDASNITKRIKYIKLINKNRKPTTIIEVLQVNSEY